MMTGIEQGASSSIAFAFQTGLVVTALFVFILSAIICGDRLWKRKFDDVFWFSLSLSIVWMASMDKEAWYTVWRYNVLSGWESGWMEGHWLPIAFTGLLIIGGVFHIHYLTKHKFQEKGWKFSALIISAVMLLAYWFII